MLVKTFCAAVNGLDVTTVTIEECSIISQDCLTVP